MKIFSGIFLFLGVVGVSGQGVPPTDPPYAPEVLVGALPGDASVNNTGASSYSVPLSVPPGTSGVQPKLGISYSSRAGNGALGVGFSLSGVSSIARMAPVRQYEDFVGGVEFNDDDRLVLDGQRLLLVSTNAALYGSDGTEYRTEIESFSKVVLHGDMGSSNCWFEVRTKAGLIYQYGKEPDAFVEPPNRSEAITWAVNRISDTAGNYMDFIYDEDSASGEHLLERIEYTGNDGASLSAYNTVEFIYTNRTDISFRYHKGAKYTTTKRLSQIEFHVDGSKAHEYRFGYTYGQTGLSQLTSVQQFFANGDSLPKTTFDWTDEDGSAGYTSSRPLAPPVEITGTDGKDRGVRFIDLNGDGLTDLVYHNGTTGGAYLNTGTNWVSATGYTPAFAIVDEGNKDRITFSDVNGDGLPDMFYNHLDGSATQSGAYLNTGSGWATASSAAFVPPLHISFEGEEYTGVELVDFNADGIADLYYHRHRNFVLEHAKYLGTTNGWIQTTLYSEFQQQNDGGTDGGSRFLDIDGNRSLDELYAGTQYFSFARPANPFAGGPIVIGGGYLPPYDFLDGSDKSTGVQLKDVNGDGLSDFLFHHKLAGGTVTNGAYLNTGTGWSANSDTNFIPPVILKEDNAASKGVMFVDANADGLIDIVQNNTTTANAWINTGMGWVQDARYAPPQPLVASDGKDKGARFVDINGDGMLDQVVHCGTTQNAWINQAKTPMLKKITTGVRDGGHYTSKTEFFYRPLTDNDVYTKGEGAQFPAYDIQGPLQVVSEMAKDNILGGKYWSMFTYANGRSHRDRGFLGFQIFESYDPQTKISKIEYLAHDFPLTGAQLKTETRYIPDPDSNPAGQLLKEVENTCLYYPVWSGQPSNVYSWFHYFPRSIERAWELGNTNDVVSEVTTYNWFDYQDTTTDIPNLVQPTSYLSEIWYGDISKTVIDYGGGTRLQTLNSFFGWHDDWIIGRLGRSTVTHSRSNKSDVVRIADFYYYTADGLLALEIVEPDRADKLLQTYYEYDSFGNITNKTVSGANITARSPERNIYDPTGRFVTEAKNALGHTETIVSDPVTGMVKSRTGPNLLPTSWKFDSLGRATRENRADGTGTTTTYAWISGVSVSTPSTLGGSNTVVEAEWSVTTEAAGAASSIVYFDRQGREIRSVSKAPDGRDIYRDTGRNLFGQTVSMSEPYFSGDTPGWGYAEHDMLGRRKYITAPDGTKTAFGYDGLVSSVTNNYVMGGSHESENQHITTYKNAKGETLKIVDTLNNEIRYEYDAAGNIEKTIDQENNAVVMEYDVRGHKIRQDDPDLGEWFYMHNVLGELVSQTNANGHVTAMDYDLLGRVATRTTYANSAVESVAKWHYDNTGEGGKLGALWREELFDSSGTNLVTRKTHAYDSYGRPLLSLYNVDKKWYYTSVEYDSYSRIEKSHRFWRPQCVTNQLDHSWNRFTSVNTYNELGAITEVADGTGHIWWEIDEADFDAKGHLLEYTLGNDVVTTHNYDPDSGRIDAIRLTNLSAGIHIHGFQHDNLGNLEQRTLNRTLKPNLSEDFTYDRLNRVRTATVDTTVLETTYDSIGNIQTKTGLSGTYQYGGPRPHAVTSADGITYTYDSCGNMLGRYQSGTNISSTAWTSFNKPSTIYNGWDGSEFTYDTGNSRILQISFKDGDGTKKLYLDGFEQEENLVGSQLDRANWQWTHKETRVYISTPSGTIGIHVQDGLENVERRYLHRDHLGSITAVSDKDADLLAEYSFDTWGAYRDKDTWLALAPSSTPDTSIASGLGYTGQEQLSNLDDLVHMNGRIYDANLGRFLSADPIIQAPGDLQSYNRYSYVRNNPLKYIDPSGYSWWSEHVTDPISDAWDDVVDFVEEYWEAITVTIIAVVVTVVTFGLAAPAVGGIVSGVWASVLTGAIAGAAGGFAAGFSGTLLYGGSLSDAFENGLVGAAWGAVAGAVGGYINAGAWAAMGKALAHGVTGSVLSLAQGGSWETGFLAGFGAGVVAGYMSGANIMVRTVAAALVGGTASALGGGKFANGAVTAAVTLLIGEGFKKLGEWHYSRNKKNDAFWESQGFGADRDDINIKEFGDLDAKGNPYVNVKAANAHQIGPTNTQNIKITTAPTGPKWLRGWFSKYGRYEIILRPNNPGVDGSLYSVVSDSVNLGTLNYGQNNFTHTIMDILPGLTYGNIPNPSVSSSVGLRLFELIGADKGHQLGRALGL